MEGQPLLSLRMIRAKSSHYATYNEDNACMGRDLAVGPGLPIYLL